MAKLLVLFVPLEASLTKQLKAHVYRVLLVKHSRCLVKARASLVAKIGMQRKQGSQRAKFVSMARFLAQAATTIFVQKRLARLRMQAEGARDVQFSLLW